MARKLLAVTACATGVAHTYMAEKALIKAAKKMGVLIKVETQGATGIGHKLTAKDVQIGEAVIFATDTKVRDAERFENKKVMQINVSDPIKDAEKVINDALALADKK
ncbi:PTS fructose transporter subunit IIB [Pediococcus ethanolidurans]|uniref:PTS system, fructose-specific IIB component n=1 Tax=Pediococcus ethanolidurans TaxID=319653 RepID=A0A0R2K243_9LACO|nr:fructose PTS transporter subunit IIB [Pediococcus ethanolidurans]KRN83619.1 PTS system, fructose-specific IIBC component [Pediococcus ethanolidurans]MBU7563987.1 fructose PTS transporter subunit IIB [Pediococcus ethanolidurans]MCV3323871.1 fructose PTS transporter subunit IIB [Pediococcus ethanolidurans]MCV3327740.1 fructose PTS transporter subunit IIB [Pediococcus ethanolidurans]MCV3555461.1 fructose PTS transporter subunit IIB [Pediococcus ethanolidurans]